ncbi:2-octaprenyl-6-methoxyphenyl hydroxylase [Shewanella sp. WXL01]|uniref:2-octaprenyl-6-methoxyphenyl hydroxylase n=1 Tax=Shewanella sp. WXL01 TaxID=2709721 RepID=UPI0014385890|nr:2-octaprenyl-6-methoxyphenyl hydroxylase [Shewanella sp. WXL01]NKF50785.1 2-octaprenyl-6-methoxyphenyl hydroxylase [Shewanella sp. WXL01]
MPTSESAPSSQSATSSQIATSSQALFDVVIVGGAMAGATLALALTKLSAQQPNKPLRIALIEAKQVDASHPGFDARSIAIAHGSIFQLQQLGIWQHIAHLGSAINQIHVSDRGHFGMTELLSESLNVDAFGQVVELASVGQVLMAELEKLNKQHPNILSLYCPAGVEEVSAQADYQQLTLTTGEQLNAKLVVAADGAFSKVRTQLNQPSEQVDFEQSAIVANVVTDKAHQGWAFERFTEHGPIALLPMSDVQGKARLSLVWAMQPTEVERVKALPKSEFLAELQTAFGHRCGRFTDVGALVSYPLTLSYMPRPFYHRCVFVGNAAQTLHPIAGQGFNLGLRDINGLIKAIEQALAAGEADLGSSELIHSYYQSRQQDRDATLNNIEFLVRGFSNQHWPLVAGRSLGLRLLSWLPPLKTPVAEIAMGWR